MAEETPEAGAAEGTAEPQPSFVRDVTGFVKREVTGMRTDFTRAKATLADAGEEVVHNVETEVETVAARVFGVDPLALVRDLGSVHAKLDQLAGGVSADLANAKARIEDAIISIARHIAGVPFNG